MKRIPLVLSTSNPHKLREVREILGDAFDVRGTDSLQGYVEPKETGHTFCENATIKALAASALTGDFVLADDSGLEVDALNGAPGIYSARYAGEPRNHAANIALLLQNLAKVRGKARSARFRCVLALARRGKILATFEGTVEGSIASAPRGENGFGYDPVFIPEGYCKTFAELDPKIKNNLSHRARALAACRAFPAWAEAFELP